MCVHVCFGNIDFQAVIGTKKLPETEQFRIRQSLTKYIQDYASCPSSAQSFSAMGFQFSAYS